MARARRWVAGTTVAVLLLGGAGYVAADAADLVPGIVTTAPLPARSATSAAFSRALRST